MKDFRYLRFVLSLMLLLIVTVASAQSTGDKLFAEGQKLQQVMSVSSQNKAIKKFRSAKVMYTSADKKQRCDEQIAVCNANIASIKKGSNKVISKPKEEKTEEKKVEFSIGTRDVVFDEKMNFRTITVTADSSTNWEVSAPANTFVKATRNNSIINVEVEANPSTIRRQQVLSVSHDGTVDEIMVIQSGKPVLFGASSNLIEYKVKGGTKQIELYTNSDSTIVSNSGESWYVDSKPSWVEVSLDVKKKKNVLSELFGKSDSSSSDDLRTTNVKITVAPLLKSEPEYLAGRRGEIVFVSQDKTVKVIVLQQK